MEGDVVRFEDGDLHGFENTGSDDFEYLSVTSPPVNFRGAYDKDWSRKGENDAQPGAAGDAPQAARP
jgi:mannose-6-phosphate isomerase-like protein (cupin superfamily)